MCVLHFREQRALGEGRPYSGPLVEHTMNSSHSRRTLIKRIAVVAAGSIGPVLATVGPTNGDV
jgi:hypothetical protein